MYKYQFFSAFLLIQLLFYQFVFNIFRATNQMSNASVSVASSATRPMPRPVAVNSYKDLRPILQKTLKQLDDPIIAKLEKQTGMGREKLFYIACAFAVFYLMFGPGNALLATLIGIAYPMYCTVSALVSEANTDDTQWLVYWCAFALFSMVDVFVVNVPYAFSVYLVLKTVVLLYLALPQTYGAHNVYAKYVDSLMDCLDKSKTK